MYAVMREMGDICIRHCSVVVRCPTSDLGGYSDKIKNKHFILIRDLIRSYSIKIQSRIYKSPLKVRFVATTKMSFGIKSKGARIIL